jgi:Uma2 family endonuclease
MAGLAAIKNTRFTWDDYRSWGDDRRWEIIDGEAFDMSAAPLVRHQLVSQNLHTHLRAFFTGKKCQVLYAPVDLKLSEDDVVQPDLLVVCDPNQIKSTHIDGPPSLVIEITSPSSQTHDRVHKMNLYARAGIPEYWIVTPYPALIEVFILDGGSYRLHGGYEDRHTLKGATFPQLALPLKEVFDFPVPPEERVWVIREGRPSPYDTETTSPPLEGETLSSLRSHD